MGVRRLSSCNLSFIKIKIQNGILALTLSCGHHGVLEAAVPAAALAFAAAAAAPGSAAATPTGLSHGALHEIQQQCCCNGQRYLRVKHIPGIQQSPTT